MSEAGCFQDRDQIYRIVFARGIVSRGDGLKGSIISGGFHNIWEPRGTWNWELTLPYSAFKEVTAVSQSSENKLCFKRHGREKGLQLYLKCDALLLFL